MSTELREAIANLLLELNWRRNSMGLDGEELIPEEIQAVEEVERLLDEPE